jgi:hypothetical protein
LLAAAGSPQAHPPSPSQVVATRQGAVAATLHGLHRTPRPPSRTVACGCGARLCRQQQRSGRVWVDFPPYPLPVVSPTLPSRWTLSASLPSPALPLPCLRRFKRPTPLLFETRTSALRPFSPTRLHRPSPSHPPARGCIPLHWRKRCRHSTAMSR